jgi:hypothetical protein
MIKIEESAELRIRQGDILKNVEMVEYAIEDNGVMEISKIQFPYSIVLTQDCDLNQDYFNQQDVHSKKQNSSDKISHDKYLMSVLVAPLYNYEHVRNGEHLSELELAMQLIEKNKTPDKHIRSNSNSRYHYLEFPVDVKLVPQVIDFKHYFTCNLNHLVKHKENNFVCSVSVLYRELISQRFANFLSRIGLP